MSDTTLNKHIEECEKEKYCPLIKGNCLQDKCALALIIREQQVRCSFGIMAKELAKMRIDTYVIGDYINNHNKRMDSIVTRIDRHNDLLQFIAEEITR